MKKILILLIFLFLNSVSSLAWSKESFEDCILENMKGTGSDVAANAIKDACKSKSIGQIFFCVETDAKIINDIIYFPNKDEPFTGNNLCKNLNGSVKSKGEIKDGKKNGMWTWWYENGHRGLEKNYKDGKLDGKMTMWYGYYIGNNLTTTLYKDIKLDGQIWAEEHYKDDIKEGKSTRWYPSGLKRLEEYYKDGIKEGKRTEWYNNGQIWLEEYYKDGMKDGKSTRWYQNGQKGFEKNYKEGKLDGKQIIWHESGNVKSEKYYKENNCISGDC